MKPLRPTKVEEQYTLIVMGRRSLIDKLPPEILHGICQAHQSRHSALISSPPKSPLCGSSLELRPQLVFNISFLTFASSSRKIALSSYVLLQSIPSSQRNVTSFVYNADRVQDCDRVEWERIVLNPDFMAQTPGLQTHGRCHCDSEREKRGFARDIAKLRAMPRHQNYERGLRMDFPKYYGFCALHYEDQLDSHYAEIAYVMQRFVKPKNVCLSTDPRTQLYRCTVKKALRPSYAHPSTSNGHD